MLDNNGDRATHAFNDRLAEIRELLGLEDRTPGTVLLLLSHIPYLLGHIDILSKLIDTLQEAFRSEEEDASHYWLVAEEAQERVRELESKYKECRDHYGRCSGDHP